MFLNFPEDVAVGSSKAHISRFVANTRSADQASGQKVDFLAFESWAGLEARAGKIGDGGGRFETVLGRTIFCTASSGDLSINM